MDNHLSSRARRSRRTARRRVVALSASGLLLVGLVAATPANAAFVGTKLGTSNFEIDTSANFTQDNASPSIDWLNTSNTLTTGVVRQPDAINGTGDNAFGGGTAEDDQVPKIVTDSIPPNKSDLTSFASLQETVGTAQYLHLAWTRVQDPSGSTNMDFEFDQSSTLSSNGVTPVRTVGDLLIEYHLANGGTQVTLTKRTWAGSAWGPEAALSGNAIGSINTSAITAANAGPFGAKSARTFGEASLDLNSLFPAGQCTSFGYAYLKSRASDSFSSEIKDFTTPAAVNVTNCGSINIHKQDDAGTALSGATFTLYNNVAPLTAPRTAADTVTTLTCSTGATGNCTISNVPFGNYWIVETTTPPNHDTAADQAVNVAIGGNTPATNPFVFVDPRQQGSIIVKKTDASGQPLAGAAFTVTPPAAGVAMVEGTTGVFCLDGLAFQQYTVTESTVPFGYTGQAAQNFTVSTKSTCAARLAGTVVPDLTFVNSPKPGTINVLKTDDASPANPLGGAGFTLYKDVGVVGTYEPATDTTVQAGPNATAADGTLQFANVPLGNYCVVETSTPAGYDTAPAQCTTIALAANGQTVNLTFVDPRQRGSIIVKKVDGNGAVLAGAGFTVTPPAAGVAMVEGTTGVFCLDNLLLGTYTITESTVPFGYNGAAPQQFTVSTESTCAARLAGLYTVDKTFVDTPKPGTINVLKTDDASPANPLAGANFTLFKDEGVIGTYEPAVDTTVQAGPLTTGAAGTVQFANLPLGNYCVVETGTPAGYDTAAAQCVTIGLAANGQTTNLTFVDPRQHKVIVLVCHLGTNTLDSSPVTLGASTKSSLATPPAGFTAAQLCALGGATFSPLGHGVNSMSVNIQ